MAQRNKTRRGLFVAQSHKENKNKKQKTLKVSIRISCISFPIIIIEETHRGNFYNFGTNVDYDSKM